MPKNVKKEDIDLLRKFCDENDIVFMTPGNQNSKTIYQWDNDLNGIVEVSTEDLEGSEHKIMNHQLLVGMVRKGMYILLTHIIKESMHVSMTSQGLNAFMGHLLKTANSPTP